MSKLVTFNQAKKLKELGCKFLTHAYYSFDEKLRFHTGIYDWNTYASKDTYAVPTIAKALEWFREVKGIPCNVSLDVFEDEYRPLIYQYTGMYWEGYSVFDADSFDTHSEAESSLLDALIEYEVKRIEFNNNRTETDE